MDFIIVPIGATIYGYIVMIAVILRAKQAYAGYVGVPTLWKRSSAALREAGGYAAPLH
jgi:hypothetical protein